MKIIEVNKLPNPVAMYVRAMQSSSKRPGVIEALPEVTYVRPRVVLEEAAIAAYSRVCGFSRAHGVPITYPQMLAFPLTMTFFGSKYYPWPAMGTVHLGNNVKQHQRLNVGDELRIEVSTGPLIAHEKGQIFTLDMRALRNDQLVWEGRQFLLRLGVRQPKGPAFASALAETTPLAHQADFFAAGGIGRRYGRISGDINPIHLSGITAKMFGFRKAIAHGMWTKARALATLMPREPVDQAEAVIEFKTPLFLPARASLWTARLEDGALFEVRNSRGDKPHLRGRVTY
jgi:acyl dehydratase